MGYFDVDKQTENAPRSQAAPEPGYGHVPEYQVSSLPWVTGSVASSITTVQNYEFPYVTSHIHLRNHGSTAQGVRVGFTRAGVTGSNYVLVAGGTNIDLDVRVKSLFILGDGTASTYSLCAGLTMIPSRFAPTLTGSVSASHGTWQGVG